MNQQVQNITFESRDSQIQHLQNVNPIAYDEHKNYWIWNSATSTYKMGDDVDCFNIYQNLFGGSDIYKTKVKSEVLSAIKMIGRSRNITKPDPNFIQFKDCVVDIKTGEKFTATPDYLWTNAIPHNLGTSTSTPIIDRLFTDWVGRENKKLLYEILAYSLYRGYPIHNIFALFGSGRNGKSQFNKILENLVGTKSVCSTSLEAIGKSQFETSKMLNKSVAFVSETDSTSTLKNTAVLKSLSGGDLISGEFKNKPAFEFVNHAKIVIATNNLPSAYDESDGYASRWIIIDFPNQFKGGKPIVNTIKEPEYENLCNKLVIILKDLLYRGKFKNSKTIEERMVHLKRSSDPIMAFIDEKFIEVEGAEIYNTKFVEKFQLWLDKNSIKYTIKLHKIYQALKKNGIIYDRKTRKGNNVQIIYGLKYDTTDKIENADPVKTTDFYDDDNMTNPFEIPNGGYLEPEEYDFMEQQPPMETNEDILREYDRTHKKIMKDEDW